MKTFEERMAEIKAHYKPILDEIRKQERKVEAERDAAILEAMREYRQPNAAIELLKAGKQIYAHTLEGRETSYFVPGDDERDDYLDDATESDLDTAIHFGFIESADIIDPSWADWQYVLTEAGKRYPDALTTGNRDAGSA